MKRLTTDNPQDNVGNMLNLVFAKDNKAWMRSCGDDDKDCTLSSFVEQICKKCGCESDVDSTNTINFSEKMGDCACGMCCPVANAYFGLAQAAELRERLKQYEDATFDATPTVDFGFVRHGHWIEENGLQVCSECGEEHDWDDYRASYCDTCGAKMDAKEANNDQT